MIVMKQKIEYLISPSSMQQGQRLRIISRARDPVAKTNINRDIYYGTSRTNRNYRLPVT